jgi:hypothetical protein
MAGLIMIRSKSRPDTYLLFDGEGGELEICGFKSCAEAEQLRLESDDSDDWQVVILDARRSPSKPKKGGDIT